MTLDPFSDLPATVSGWGTLYENGPAPNGLKFVELRTMTDQDCRTSNYPRDSIYDDMICAYATAKDSCQGDSGGPLVATLPVGNSPTELVGIVSFGFGCARQGYPGVYTEVARYSYWIDRHLSR